jgi:hypothetical protein
VIGLDGVKATLLLKKILLFVLLILTLAAISQATVRTFVNWNAPQLEIFYEIKNDVWEGGSLWATSLRIVEGKGTYVWSNRLLAPYAVLAISKATDISYRHAAIAFYWIGIFAINFILFFLIKASNIKIGQALAWTIIFNFLFLIFQDRSSWGWFYTFDIFSIIFFTIFAYLVVNQKPIFFIFALFCLALTNREDAVFIAFYLTLSALSLGTTYPFLKLQSARGFVAGLILIAVSAFYTKYVRDVVSLVKPEKVDFAIGNSVTSIKTALYNLFVRNFSFESDPFFFNAPDGFWLIGSTVLICTAFKDASASTKNLILTYIVMVSAIAIFGNATTNEVRLYMPLFPMFIFIMLKTRGH